MGDLLSGAGSLIGSLAGGVADSSGATSQYQASNPYDQQFLQQQLANQGQIYGQQQDLAKALQAQMAGQGPNPAQTQYLQNVQNNIANTQSLIASQRGLNPALAVRMGTSAATAANNQAGLSAALLQQQQQLQATGALGGLYGQMQSGNLGQQQLYNQANLGQQQINSGTANENAKTRGQLAGGVLQAIGSTGAAAAGMSSGGKVPGKAKVGGDSEQNDTVDAKLSPGEIVIPRSHAQDPEKAKEFIDHILKSEGKAGKEAGYGKVLEHKRKLAELEKRLKALEGKKAS